MELEEAAKHPQLWCISPRGHNVFGHDKPVKPWLGTVIDRMEVGQYLLVTDHVMGGEKPVVSAFVAVVGDGRFLFKQQSLAEHEYKAQMNKWIERKQAELQEAITELEMLNT